MKGEGEREILERDAQIIGDEQMDTGSELTLIYGNPKQSNGLPAGGLWSQGINEILAQVYFTIGQMGQ